MDGTPKFVSLNGPDNVGKTTQLRRLAHNSGCFQLLGAVHEHAPDIWADVAGDDYARWWFETSSTAELTTMLLHGHARRSAARAPDQVGLLDRGGPMLLAVAAATCALKESRTVTAALGQVELLASALPAPPVETALLLLPSLDPERSYAITSAREGRPWTGVYPGYQRLLHQALTHQAEQGRYDAVVLCGDRSAEDIATEIAGHLSQRLPRLAPPQKGTV